MKGSSSKNLEAKLRQNSIYFFNNHVWKLVLHLQLFTRSYFLYGPGYSYKVMAFNSDSQYEKKHHENIIVSLDLMFVNITIK